MKIVEPESVGLSNERINRINRGMKKFVDEGRLPNVSTLVARNGEVAHFETCGWMDVEAQTPLQADTIFRIYSMTKPVTCVAMMMLFEKGHFKLNDPASKFIPAFKGLEVLVDQTDNGNITTDLDCDITIRDLLTHTAGFGYGILQDSPVEDLYREAGIFKPPLKIQISLPELVERVSAIPLAFQPGTGFRYSVAYDIIGYLISLIADMPFEVFLKEKIFDPLGMTDTGFYVPLEKISRFGTLYGTNADQEMILVETAKESVFLEKDATSSGGAGLVSTMADYLRFSTMLLNNGTLDGVRLLSRLTIEFMTRNQLPANLVPISIGGPWPGMGYGLGVGVVAAPNQLDTLAGEDTYRWPGASNVDFSITPSESLIGLIMTQRMGFSEHRGLFRTLIHQAIDD